MNKLFEHAIGGDGGKVVADIDAGELEVKLSYPIAKILQPILDKLDVLEVEIEKAIHGDFEDSVVHGLLGEAKDAVIKLIGG